MDVLTIQPLTAFLRDLKAKNILNPEKLRIVLNKTLRVRNITDKLIIGEVDEIELEDGFFDYFEKYNLKTSKIHLPARISKEERERIKDTALAIYKTLVCSGFARVDMFYTKDKKIVFNEVNTIPGCTSHSRYPSMLKEIGIPFEEVIDRLIELGWDK